MSDEEDFDEFPSITVNSSFHESSSFSMPSAEELATQRAREQACERELLRLRAEDCTIQSQSSEAMVSMLAHSDSSSSEGEAALAAAVGVLRVRPSPSRSPVSLSGRASSPAGPATLLRALRPLVPPSATQLFDAHLAALDTASDAQAIALTTQIGSGVSALVAETATCGAAWETEEVLGAGAWLCAACACTPPPGPAPPAPRRALRRTLHMLLDEVATDDQAAQLSGVVSGAALGSAAALELSDALRGTGPHADALASGVLRAALARLADLPDTQEVSVSAISSGLQCVWRRVSPARQYVALQLLARLLPPPGEGRGRGQGEGEEARRLLAALLHATAHKEKTTDTLKVLVAASKLQVLFDLHGHVSA